MSKRRHALVIAYCFPPYGAIGTLRTLRVVRQLVADGWDVTVITSDPRTYLPGTTIDEGLLHDVPPSVRVVRVAVWRPVVRFKRWLRVLIKRRNDVRAATADTSGGSPRGWSRGLLRWLADPVGAALSLPDREVGWVCPAVVRGFSVSVFRRPDVLYSSAPPWSGQVVALALKRLLRCPWLADFRDPWARAPWREVRYGFVRRSVAALERAVVHSADSVVFVTAANKAEYARFYGVDLTTKFEVVPNGCDPSDLRGIARPEVQRNPFVLLHAGSLYGGRTPEPLLRAVAAAIHSGAIDRDAFRLRFLGTNALPDRNLEAICRELGLVEVVEFLPRVSRHESLRAMLAASALLVLQPGHPVSVPGKVYEYLAAGRPIFAVAEDGDIAWLLGESGAGILVPSDDEAGMVDALRRLTSMDGFAFKPAPPELYDGKLRASQVAAALNRLALRRAAQALGKSGVRA